jgi:uridine phosphorylase
MPGILLKRLNKTNIAINLLQLGTVLLYKLYGVLTPKVKYGDILIVTEAEMQDDVSHWYLPNQDVIKADEGLGNAVMDYCEMKRYNANK